MIDDIRNYMFDDNVNFAQFDFENNAQQAQDLVNPIVQNQDQEEEEVAVVQEGRFDETSSEEEVVAEDQEDQEDAKSEASGGSNNSDDDSDNDRKKIYNSTFKGESKYVNPDVVERTKNYGKVNFSLDELLIMFDGLKDKKLDENIISKFKNIKYTLSNTHKINVLEDEYFKLEPTLLNKLEEIKFNNDEIINMIKNTMPPSEILPLVPIIKPTLPIKKSKAKIMYKGKAKKKRDSSESPPRSEIVRSQRNLEEEEEVESVPSARRSVPMARRVIPRLVVRRAPNQSDSDEKSPVRRAPNQSDSEEPQPSVRRAVRRAPVQSDSDEKSAGSRAPSSMNIQTESDEDSPPVRARRAVREGGSNERLSSSRSRSSTPPLRVVREGGSNERSSRSGSLSPSRLNAEEKQLSVVSELLNQNPVVVNMSDSLTELINQNQVVSNMLDSITEVIDEKSNMLDSITEVIVEKSKKMTTSDEIEFGYKMNMFISFEYDISMKKYSPLSQNELEYMLEHLQFYDNYMINLMITNLVHTVISDEIKIRFANLCFKHLIPEKIYRINNVSQSDIKLKKMLYEKIFKNMAPHSHKIFIKGFYIGNNEESKRECCLSTFILNNINMFSFSINIIKYLTYGKLTEEQYIKILSNIDIDNDVLDDTTKGLLIVNKDYSIKIANLLIKIKSTANANIILLKLLNHYMMANKSINDYVIKYISSYTIEELCAIKGDLKAKINNLYALKSNSENIKYFKDNDCALELLFTKFESEMQRNSKRKLNNIQSKNLLNNDIYCGLKFIHCLNTEQFENMALLIKNVNFNDPEILIEYYNSSNYTKYSETKYCIDNNNIIQFDKAIIFNFINRKYDLVATLQFFDKLYKLCADNVLLEKLIIEYKILDHLSMGYEYICNYEILFNNVVKSMLSWYINNSEIIVSTNVIKKYICESFLLKKYSDINIINALFFIIDDFDHLINLLKIDDETELLKSKFVKISSRKLTEQMKKALNINSLQFTKYYKLSTIIIKENINYKQYKEYLYLIFFADEKIIKHLFDNNIINDATENILLNKYNYMHLYIQTKNNKYLDKFSTLTINNIDDEFVNNYCNLSEHDMHLTKNIIPSKVYIEMFKNVKMWNIKYIPEHYPQYITNQIFMNIIFICGLCIDCQLLIVDMVQFIGHMCMIHFFDGEKILTFDKSIIKNIKKIHFLNESILSKIKINDAIRVYGLESIDHFTRINRLDELFMNFNIVLMLEKCIFDETMIITKYDHIFDMYLEHSDDEKQINYTKEMIETLIDNFIIYIKSNRKYQSKRLSKNVDKFLSIMNNYFKNTHDNITFRSYEIQKNKKHDLDINGISKLQMRKLNIIISFCTSTYIFGEKKITLEHENDKKDIFNKCMSALDTNGLFTCKFYSKKSKVVDAGGLSKKIFIKLTEHLIENKYLILDKVSNTYIIGSKEHNHYSGKLGYLFSILISSNISIDIPMHPALFIISNKLKDIKYSEIKYILNKKIYDIIDFKKYELMFDHMTSGYAENIFTINTEYKKKYYYVSDDNLIIKIKNVEKYSSEIYDLSVINKKDIYIGKFIIFDMYKSLENSIKNSQQMKNNNSFRRACNSNLKKGNIMYNFVTIFNELLGKHVENVNEFVNRIEIYNNDGEMYEHEHSLTSEYDNEIKREFRNVFKQICLENQKKNKTFIDQLLEFWTGSSCLSSSRPIRIKLTTINRSLNNKTPIYSNICFNQLNIPTYNINKYEFREKEEYIASTNNIPPFDKLTDKELMYWLINKRLLDSITAYKIMDETNNTFDMA
jgi:hypothetical protein